MITKWFAIHLLQSLSAEMDLLEMNFTFVDSLDV